MNTIDSQTGILYKNRVQCAFKDLMIHEILQFTLRIAFRCVLHRCESQEIRCQKLFYIFHYMKKLSVKLLLWFIKLSITKLYPKNISSAHSVKFHYIIII